MQKKIAFKYLLKTASGGLILLCSIFFVNCTSNRVAPIPPTDSTSASEVVAAIISGTVNITSSTGTQAMAVPRGTKNFFARLKNEFDILPQAHAQLAAGITCPTLQPGAGDATNCSVNATPTTPQMIIQYTSCNMPVSPTGVLWQGVMYLTSTGSSNIAWTCGTFPTFVAGNVITRSFGAPTDRIVLNPIAGTSSGLPILNTLLDTSSSTYGSSPLVTNTGLTITFTGAVARRVIINGIHIGANVGSYNVWDYELNTDLVTGVTVDLGNNVTAGTVNIQDRKNPPLGTKVQRVGTSTVAGTLTYSAGCCMPTGGSIQTTWNDGTPTEILAFTGTCNAATLNAKSITLTQCL